jgi:hypothetical protein
MVQGESLMHESGFGFCRDGDVLAMDRKITVIPA